MNAKTILVLVAVLGSVICAVLWQAERRSQDAETKQALATLEKTAVASRAQADSAIAQADLRAHLDSLSWRSYLADVLAHTKASDRDSAQRAVNQAVRRARQEVTAAIGDTSRVAAGSLSDTSVADTSCRVWSTCRDDAYRRADDSLLRWHSDSLRQAIPVLAKTCTAAVAQAKFEQAIKAPQASSNRWLFAGSGVAAGILLTLLITH
jgi:hypothetical protein